MPSPPRAYCATGHMDAGKNAWTNPIRGAVASSSEPVAMMSARTRMELRSMSRACTTNGEPPGKTLSEKVIMALRNRRRRRSLHTQMRTMIFLSNLSA